MTPAAAIERLRHWRGEGWLRALDSAFADFVHELDPQAPASLLLAAALLAHLEGRGHSCLPLDETARDAAAVLGWPPRATPELARALADLPADAAAALAAWGECTVVQVDPADEGGSTPLVLCGQRLYLRRYWRYESRVAAQVLARAPLAAARPAADLAQARSLLRRLFGAAGTVTLEGGPDWQQVACALALRGGLTLVTGGPGTGKTYTAARLLVLLQALHGGPEPLRVALAAPTGKAAARLRQAIDTTLHDLRRQLGDELARNDWAARLGPARTLHALLGTRPGTRRFVHDAANPLALDLLVVDEASMVHLEMMAALLDAMPADARVVLLGDKDQLASVEAGAVLDELCRAPAGRAGGGYRDGTVRWVRDACGQALPAAQTGDGSALAQQTVVLRQSHRFAGPIGQLARAVNRGDAPAALRVLRDAPGGEVSLLEAHDALALPPFAVEGRGGAAGGYRPYLEELGRRPADAAAFDAWATALLRRFDGFRVLCAVREGPWGVAGMNLAIERSLVDRGLLQRRGEWYEGRPVMVARNDPALGVFNGDIGIVLGSPGDAGRMRAWFPDAAGLRSVAVARLADVETAFALTVHKSQGSEFDHVALVLPDEDSPVLTRELVYTGITRARHAFTLVARDVALLETACRRRTRRFSGLGAMLDR